MRRRFCFKVGGLVLGVVEIVVGFVGFGVCVVRMWYGIFGRWCF